jgi:conjugative relaxase-like TrwC/TraI family protein
LVRYQAAREYVNERGETVSTMEHRAGWDATFSAPKSVSLTALVGGDEKVREAHCESVKVALDELEKYVQARIGGNHPAETTGKWVAASFEHDSARRRRNCIHMSCSSISRKQRTVRRAPCNHASFIARSSTRRQSIAQSWRYA